MNRNSRILAFVLGGTFAERRGQRQGTTFLVGIIAVIGTVDYTRTHLSECVQHMYRACKYYDGFEMLMTEAGRIWGILRKGSIHCRRNRRISSLSVSFIQRNFIFGLHGLALRNRFAPQQKSHLARKDA